MSKLVIVDHITREYGDVRYEQFQSGRVLRLLRTLAGVATWPVIWPLAMVCRPWPPLFRTASELLSLVPYIFGVVIRGEFYRFALRRCGRNVVVEFGAVFIYPAVSVGDNVLIGRFNTIHHCDFGSYVLTGEGCAFLSGSRYHRYGRTDIPMAEQGGQLKRIRIGDDCWVGAHSIVMEDVDDGAIVGAGSVVTKPVQRWNVVAGNPARVIRTRESPQAQA